MKNTIKTIMTAMALTMSISAFSVPASADVADGFPPAFRDALSPAVHGGTPDWVREAFDPARFETGDKELDEALNPSSFFDDYSPALREALEPAKYMGFPDWAKDALNPGNQDENTDDLAV